MTLLRPNRGGRRPTPGQRLARRALESFDPEALEPGWRALSRHYTEDARRRAGEAGITVIAGPGRALDAPGVWIPSVMRVGLDGNILPVEPEALDLVRSAHFRALAALHGVYVHEIGHAVHTPRGSREDIPAARHEAWALLEEARMEARVCEDDPDNARWLRTSARQLILDEVKAEGISDPCGLSVLLDGRVLAGSLHSADIPPEVRAAIDEGVGAHRREELADILVEATRIEDDDALAAPMMELADRLAALREEDIESETIFIVAGDALAAALAAAGEEAAEELEGMGASQQLDVALVVVRSDAGDERPQAASESSSPSQHSTNRPGGRSTGTASGWRVRMGSRPPTPQEEKAKQLLTSVLRRIFLPERERQRRNRERPGGRLRPREALRADADRSAGRMTNAKPWRHRVHQITPTTRIDVGIMIDTSGSMSGTETEVAAATWIVASAAEALGGHACVAGFGDSASLLIRPGEIRRDVPVFESRGGTERVRDAALLTLEELATAKRQREWGSNATLLVILSDGIWSDREARYMTELRAQLNSRGGHVILIGIDSPPRDHDVDEIDFVTDVAEIPEVIGGAMVAAKARVEQRIA